MSFGIDGTPVAEATLPYMGDRRIRPDALEVVRVVDHLAGPEHPALAAFDNVEFPVVVSGS